MSANALAIILLWAAAIISGCLAFLITAGAAMSDGPIKPEDSSMMYWSIGIFLTFLAGAILMSGWRMGAVFGWWP